MDIHGPWTCASSNRLQELKDVSEEDAELIRKLWRCTKTTELEAIYPDVEQFGRDWFNPPSFGDKKRWAVDRILRTHGVEYLGQHTRSGKDIKYCNAGDTYAGTVLFYGRHLRVGCWGDLVEHNLIRQPEGF